MEMEKKVCSETNFDRISALPEPLKHHIVSYLTTKCAIRTSILSSSWRTVWTGLTHFNLDGLGGDCSWSLLLPLDMAIDRDDADIRMKKKKKRFHDFLYRVFGSIKKLEGLQLRVPEYDFGVEVDSHLDHWLGCAVGFGVKKLDLHVECSRYRLSRSVLSCMSITSLRLWNCEIDLSSLSDTQLPSLRELWLRHVYVLDCVLEGLLPNCLNLQTFVVYGCQGLTRLKIFGLTKLETVGVTVTLPKGALKAIEIDAPELVEFCYVHESSYTGSRTCEIDMSHCTNMKQVELGGIPFDDDDLSAFLEAFPVLETLTVRKCNNFKYVEISSQQLASLTFDNCSMLEKVNVDTMKLQVFSFYGSDPISFQSKSSSLNLREAYIFLHHPFSRENWKSELVKFLVKLGQCGKLWLAFPSVKEFLIPENIRMNSHPPLCGVKQLLVEVQMGPFKDKATELIESLLWLAPCPESISITYPEELFHSYNMPCHKLLKFKYEEPLKGNMSCGCWNSLAMHCWQHSLSEVLLETQEQDESKTKHLSSTKALLMDHDKEVNTKIANFFQQPRIDGKVVSFVTVSKPKDELRW